MADMLLANSFSLAPNKLMKISDNSRCNGRRALFVHYQGSSKGNLFQSANGKSRAEIIGVRNLVPYCSSSPTSVELQEGIGIVKFLRGKSFFITGATGFLAKVLVEKLLRTVPDVGKIFLLIKAKNKDDAMERIKNEIINTELFKCLQETYGKSCQNFMLSKLVPVVGDVCESDLGFHGELADMVADEVDFIVNSAANTTFDERYDVALDVNTKGQCHLMEFAKKCRNLKLFLHVSTAYVNGQREGVIMEKPFRMGDSIAREKLISESIATSFIPVLDIENELKLALDFKYAFDDSAKVAQKMKELGLERSRTYGWQTTYVFTKAMGEMLINNMRGDIPVAIIRPSIVESTFKEPFPGWIEGNRMLDPIILRYGKGKLTGFLFNPNGIVDVVPVDVVLNATLAAIARDGMSQKPEINIYHVASSVANPLVYKDFYRLLYEHFDSCPILDSRGIPIQIQPMKAFLSMEEFSDHVKRDAIDQIRQTRLASSNEKLSKKLEIICRKSADQAKNLAQLYEPYTLLYRGRFDNSNTQKLMESMSEEEKRCFGFDVGSIDWEEYIKNIHIPGLRRHVMKGRGMAG